MPISILMTGVGMFTLTADLKQKIPSGIGVKKFFPKINIPKKK